MTPAESMLRLEILPASQLARLTQDEYAGVLGGVCFSHPVLVCDAPDLPLLAVDMALPSGDAPVCEIWHSHEPLQSGQRGPIRYRQGDTLLFGCMSLDEAIGDPSGNACPPLQASTEAAYRSIFELLDTLGYPYMLRVWNYFPAINRESHALERYRQFNIGRQEAFLARGRSVIGNVPAACALGSASGGLQIAFLAARVDMTGIENPRQVSAYHYPSEYGPRSPTFARAGRVRLGGRNMLFISGTASIVGHQTLHPGDVVAQTRECLHNIAAIVAKASHQALEGDFRLDQLAYKVYVRHAEDMVAVRHEISQFIGDQVSIVFLQADVCRADLLVEIEASGGHAIGSARMES